MLRQAVEIIAFRRAGRLAAVFAKGFSCCEHERGMAAFAGHMRYRQDADMGMSARGALRDWLPFRRRLARFSLPDGTDVLTMGRFSAHARASQVTAVAESPAACDRYVGTLGGGFVNKTPLAMEECFASLVVNSDANLAAAFDGGSVVMGGSSPESTEILDWIEAGTRAGTLRFLPMRRGFGFADAQAASDMIPAPCAPTPGYERAVLRCSETAVAVAA